MFFLAQSLGCAWRGTRHPLFDTKSFCIDLNATMRLASLHSKITRSNLANEHSRKRIWLNISNT